MKQITPARAHADAAHADRLRGGFGRENRRCKGGSGSQRGGCLAGAAQKLAAVHVEFVVHKFATQLLRAFYAIAAGGVLVCFHIPA